jgi:hypothetical protein
MPGLHGSADATRDEETIAPDEAAVTARFVAFLKAATEKRYATGTRQRFNQARATACVDAEFTVLDGLAAGHRVGLFATPRTYTCWIRFANATSLSDKDKDTRGMAIKVLDVPGGNLTPGVTSQDFILNSHPVMMVGTTKEFLELLEANEAGGFRRTLYFLSHLKAARIAFASRANPTSHLDIPYWSTTPYQLGAGAVKYIARPASPTRSQAPASLTDNYLEEAMRARLAREDATFDLLVQPQVDARRTPIEDASVEWREQDAPYVPVARIRIPAQSIDDAGKRARCEETAFNPWHCLPEHRPLGGMNRARREIYAAMAEFRRGSSTRPQAVRTP